jgi:hemerythrin-like metal-binding domain
MEKREILAGVSYVDIPEAGLSVLCGCPENVVKFLFRDGIIAPTESGGARYETGPNAILLSELPVQGGRFCNLAEFPVLQMLYRQGMIIPGHPNNTGRKPMIIGLREQVEAQSRYIALGNYGLSSREELEAAGLSPAVAEREYRIKLKFAFGAIKRTEELLDLRIIDGHAIALREGAFVRRIAQNRYEFICGGQSAEVDLNLPPGGSYGAPYELPSREISREKFAVVHIGEGDGWDTERPCMGSLVVHGDDLYLVDSGPNIAESLEHLSLKPGDLRGVFVSHVHDDHFVGLPALLASDHRLEFYALPCVRRTVERKLEALCSICSRDFRRFFEVRDLEEGRWNELRGLGVLPRLSPHPVENSVFRFRSADSSGYKVYAHLADLTSFSVLDSMTTSDGREPGISSEDAARVKGEYLERAELKKIDGGGGMIHGAAADFAEDSSDLVLLSHTDSRAVAAEASAKTGLRVADFGEETVLIPSGGAAAAERAPEEKAEPAIVELVRSSRLVGPEVSEPRLGAIARNASPVSFAKGAAIVASEDRSILVLVKGSATLFAARRRLQALGPGDVYGEEAAFAEGCCLFEARAETEVEAVLVPFAAIEDCPAAVWRLREEYERSLAGAKAVFDFAWRAEYSVGCAEIDEQHRKLFSLLGGISAAYSSGSSCPDAGDQFHYLVSFASEHFDTEERLMREASYEGLPEHKREHETLLAEARERMAATECGDELAAGELADFFKDWLLKHTLLKDRQYMPWLADSK